MAHWLSKLLRRVSGKNKVLGAPTICIAKTDKAIHVQIGEQNLSIVPSSLSQVRAATVMPTKPTENVSHLLGKIDLAASSEDTSVLKQYLPSEAVDWVVTAIFPDSPRLHPQAISNAFDRDWRQKYGSFMAYGRDADSARWTFLISANGPKAVTDLKIAWCFLDFNKASGHSDISIFEQRLAAVSDKLQKIGTAKLEASLSPADAARKSMSLHQLKKSCGHHAALFLTATDGQLFDGRLIWDVMLCLGLKWGDMDCFHWTNSSGEGDDFFFSVETSTPPGYFLPEMIAANKLHTVDLVFGFSIPRSPAPGQVLDAMARAAAYCRDRMGGNILDQTGAPVDLPSLHASIDRIVAQLKDEGMPAGSHDALRLF